MREKIKILSFYKVKFYFRDMESMFLDKGLNVEGYYSGGKKEIHIGLMADTEQCIKNVYHEIGHFIDHMLSDDSSYFYSKLDEDAKVLFEFDAYELNDYASTNVQEFVAVAFGEYFYNPNYLNEIPATKEFIKDYLVALENKFHHIVSNDLNVMKLS